MWTTTLHARFVHAVGLLSDTDSMFYHESIFWFTIGTTVKELKGYAEVGPEAHGRERSHSRPRQESFAGQSDGSGEEETGFGRLMESRGASSNPVRSNESESGSKWSNESRGEWLPKNSSAKDDLRQANNSSEAELVQYNGQSSPTASTRSLKEVENPSLEFTLGRSYWNCSTEKD
ncbi:hypothetical protein HPP92_027045 [Vanilla planifolia]|uniref:Uncharacterized protein n=1 Tax=Vanilla planifolia TaxID=51239 RepID=A0A835PBA8_VANPL|nr:hypothetical protein HPP92_027164 [Vanilla planifolia]KAG0449902.1 hypothetical protein HPP92_027045 [Vanilla planifolia]